MTKTIAYTLSGTYSVDFLLGLAMMARFRLMFPEELDFLIKEKLSEDQIIQIFKAKAYNYNKGITK